MFEKLSQIQDKTENLGTYKSPTIRLVLFDSDEELLQGVIETSDTIGPHVDPDKPDNPEDPTLVEHGSVWDKD